MTVYPGDKEVDFQATHVYEKNGYNVPKAIYKKPRKGEIYRNFCNINKAKSELEFKPSIKLNEGVVKTINWFFKNYKTIILI